MHGAETGMVGEVKLGLWVRSLRDRYRRETLSQDRAERLEELAGWSWDTRVVPVQTGVSL